MRATGVAVAGMEVSLIRLGGIEAIAANAPTPSDRQDADEAISTKDAGECEEV